MGAKKRKFQQVRPEDFDVRLLRRLAREGRLYFDITEPDPVQSAESRLQQVLRYVEAIHQCASPDYIAYIADIWRCIISDPVLNDRLFIQKGRHQGETNRYRVMAIVTVLYERGVYESQRYSLLDLHHRLENTTRKDSVYSSRLNYALTNPQCRYMAKVIQQLRDKNAE